MPAGFFRLLSYGLHHPAFLFTLKVGLERLSSSLRLSPVTKSQNTQMVLIRLLLIHAITHSGSGGDPGGWYRARAGIPSTLETEAGAWMVTHTFNSSLSSRRQRQTDLSDFKSTQ